MDGFRHTMNLTLVEQSNSSRNCAGNDANENALLVSGGRGCYVDDREGASGREGGRYGCYSNLKYYWISTNYWESETEH